MTTMDMALEIAVKFPVTVVEVELNLADTPIELRSKGTIINGVGRTGAWMVPAVRRGRRDRLPAG